MSKKRHTNGGMPCSYRFQPRSRHARTIIIYYCSCCLLLLLQLLTTKNFNFVLPLATAATTENGNQQAKKKKNDFYFFDIQLSKMSDFGRSMAAQGAHPTNPSRPKRQRRYFPQNVEQQDEPPHVCLAFLSCCDRTDLLSSTLDGVIRHMEEDEPDYLRYEIAWVDNGSDPDNTRVIQESHQIDHALTLDMNTGLAYGMNLLIFNLCTAPYILLLEEDWLYLDHLVAPQTFLRRNAIATGIAVTERGLTSYDGRSVMGVFLRPETYGSFMEFPFLDVWETTNVDIKDRLLSMDANNIDDEESCRAKAKNDDEDSDDDSPSSIEVNYQIVCSDVSAKSKYIWGSYTNGAGLYKRQYLHDIGRMYGEPGDAFHDRYVESNYAYRVGVKYCHAALRLGPCHDLANPTCTAAFYHIGGGRGTRPMKATDTKCATDLWNFVGTPLFAKFQKVMYLQQKQQQQQNQQQQPIQEYYNLCTLEELQELRLIKAREQDAAAYRQQVKERNRAVFEKERKERDKMIETAQLIRSMDPEQVRGQIESMKDYSAEEILEAADRMEQLAKSAHPLQGFWDGHGRPLV